MAPTTRLTILLAICAYATAQYEEERAPRYIASQTKAAPAPPVAILKQINRHNEDGSYTYGYESADGSFKIETKSPTGEVKGKYGYKDDTGKVRVIEYGANKYGFQPAGEGITVAPPTLVDETTREEGLRPAKAQQTRTQYRAQPAQQAVDYDYEEPQYRPAPAPRPAPRPAPAPAQYRPAPSAQQYRPQQQAAPAPPRPQFFPGAAPDPVQQEQLFNPAPAPKPYRPKQDFRAAPAVEYTQNFAPAPQQSFAQEPQYSAPQQFSQHQPRSHQAPFSMLDELLKEYALPQGGSAPTHDITFGSY